MWLIDADVLMETFAVTVKLSNNSDFAREPSWNDAVSLVKMMPTVDAVEVIRCKDCRYYDASAKSMVTLCTRKQGCRETIPEGFCGWAIPKMDEVDE